ncbi:hypothetical protein KJ870_07870 [bacterium]|nr:hypothetical protein [bacterium]MBU1434839.1 hypothetical protein [bacterium]MBU1503944.1 hypothetical protein [bacterium]
MKIQKSLVFGMLLAFSLVFSGCSGNNSDSPASAPSATDTVVDENGTLDPIDVNSTAVTVVLPVSSRVLTLNSEAVQIEVRVFDNANLPYSDGLIKLKYPNDVLSGRDIGSFDKLSSVLTNGKAIFNYTAPANLDANTSNIIFGFYHDSTPTNVKAYTFSIVPETNQTISNNYVLQSSLDGSNVSMSLSSSKSVVFYVSDDNNVTLDNSSIASIKVVSLNPALITLTDLLSGTTNSEITVLGKNSISLNATSNTISGIAPLKVTADFINSNGDPVTIEKVFNIVVLSGPPTAMSLSYASTEHTDEQKSRAKFVENWVLTVTDKYNNRVNTNPGISMGMLAGYAQSSAGTSNVANYLYYGTTPGATLSDNYPYDKLTATVSAFDNVDLINDTLITFGDGYKYAASGKWDIQSKTSDELELVDDYNGSDVSSLGFAVGHNYRSEICDDGAGESVALVYPKDNNFVLDDTGSMNIKVEYDYYLVGKSVVLWANLTGSDNGSIVKIGESKKITLRALGLTSDSVNIAKGFTGVVHLNISITDTTEYYKNANFGYLPEVTAADASFVIAEDSMDNGIMSCINGGVGYVDINITSGPSEAGVVKLVNVLPSREF